MSKSYICTFDFFRWTPTTEILLRMNNALLSVKEYRGYFVRQLLRYICDEKNELAKLILDTKDLMDTVVDDTGATLLHFASRNVKTRSSDSLIFREYGIARNGNAEITSYLIQLGFDVNAQDKFGNTPLMCVLRDAYEELGMLLVVDTSCERLAIVKILLKAKPNLYLMNSYNLNSLQLAFRLEAIFGNSADMVKRILENVVIACENDCKLVATVLFNNGCSFQQTMLLNNPDLTKILIAHDYPMKIPYQGKLTVLHAAVGLMSLENVKILIQHGASIYVEDYVGLTPLQYYAKDRDFSNFIARDDQQPEIVEIFMNLIEDVHKRTSQNKFIVEAVARAGNEKAIEILFRYNINFQIQDGHGQTFLHHFATNRSSNVVKLLNGKNFDLNERDRKGQTALVKAVLSNNPRFTKFLLEQGADPNTRVSQMSVLDIAVNQLYRNNYAGQDNAKNMNLLLQFGADPQRCNRPSIIAVCQTCNRLLNAAKVPLAHLALEETLGKVNIVEIRKQIRNNRMFQNYFELCKRKLNKMKNVIIYRPSLSMFELLTMNEETIVKRYALNQELLEKLETVNRKSHSNFYYHGLVRKRLANIISKIKLIQKAALVIGKLNSMRRSLDAIIVREIISYLGDTELQNLNKLV